MAGHHDVAATMIYTHVFNRGPFGVRSTLDSPFVSATISAYTARTISAYADQHRYPAFAALSADSRAIVCVSLQRRGCSNTSWADRQGEGLRERGLVSGGVVADRDRVRGRLASAPLSTGSVSARQPAAMSHG